MEGHSTQFFIYDTFLSSYSLHFAIYLCYSFDLLTLVPHRMWGHQKIETQTKCLLVGAPLAPRTHVSMDPLTLFNDRDFLVIRITCTACVLSIQSLMSRLRCGSDSDHPTATMSEGWMELVTRSDHQIWLFSRLFIATEHVSNRYHSLLVEYYPGILPRVSNGLVFLVPTREQRLSWLHRDPVLMTIMNLTRHPRLN